jgi:hypothetical protein
MGGQRTFETARQCDLEVDKSGSHNSWCRSIWTAVVLFEVAMGGFQIMLTNRKIVSFFLIRTRRGNGGTLLSLVLSSNQGRREIASPEQVLSDRVKIRNYYVLGADIKIK